MGAKIKKEKTKAPSSKGITRNGVNFTFNWQVNDVNHNAGQWYDWLIDDTGKDKWHKKATKVGVKKRNASKKISLSNYYPVQSKKFLYKMRFRVKGRRANYTTGSGKKAVNHVMSVSKWASADFVVQKPNKPTLTCTLDNELTNKCVFEWTTATSNSDAKMFYDTQWETYLFKNSSETDGSKLDWSQASTGTSTANNSSAIVEDTSVLYSNNDSYTRWFRIRARGPRGASGWAYAYHVYARPNQSANVAIKDVKETGADGFVCSFEWDVTGGIKNPIDRTIAQYTIVVPDENLSCPNGASWTDGNISADTSDKDMAVFSIDDLLSRDQCLFVRVNTQHDSNITYGRPMLAKVGFLKDPAITSVVTDNVTHKATITATNASDVEDSVLVVTYVGSNGERIDSGIIEHGDSSVTVQCPNWDSNSSVAFEVRAVVGTYSKQTRTDGVDSWAVKELMRSKNIVRQGGTVPVAPSRVSVERVGDTGTVQVSWNWSWADANGAEISWANHSDAWESTDEPETYVISNLHAAKWNIANLELGETWYVRVRLLSGDINGENVTKSPWSDISMGEIDLSSAPNKPKLELSKSVTKKKSIITASWVYAATDNKEQQYAEVCLYNGANVAPTLIAKTSTGQQVNIDISKFSQFQQGHTYQLICRVRSDAGRYSDWSDPQSFTVAEPISCNIVLSNDSFRQETQTYNVEDATTGDVTEVTRTYTALYQMPLKLTVNGAGTKLKATVAIERSAPCHLLRPDETMFDGYEGETVFLKEGNGEAFTFNITEKIGNIDDGAKYRIVASVEDDYGQVAPAVPVEFEVHWEQQALIPSASISVISDYNAISITPIAPQQGEETDVCDIYRLSADMPTLIVSGGTFGTEYVDPYPALNENGGHRIVLRTANGDYNTEDNENAWIDTHENEDDIIVSNVGLIDFDGEQLEINHNFEMSNKWDKGFTSTKYLGGSVQGDWNLGVERSASINTVVIPVSEMEQVLKFRRLAEYSGICHVRTIDGSSFAADVQVSETRPRKSYGMLAEYALTVTRVDTQELDGIDKDEWDEQHELE